MNKITWFKKYWPQLTLICCLMAFVMSIYFGAWDYARHIDNNEASEFFATGHH